MGDHLDASYDIQCPQCKTSKYRNPLMKLMVNVCGHPLCSSCVAMYFIKESGKCPECDLVLKKGKFRAQVFEDPIVEKEIDIRRRIMKIYNKQEYEFETLNEWNDYLEEIENIVFNLTNDLNILETGKKIDAYERKNKDNNKSKHGMLRKSKEDEELERLIEEETFHKQQLSTRMMEQNNFAAVRNKNKASLLQDLMASEGDAALIVAAHNERRLKEEEEMMEIQATIPVIEKVTQFSSGISIGIGAGAGTTGGPPASYIQAQAYVYTAPLIPQHLQCPSWDELEPKGFLSHVRKAGPQAVAGGYTEHYACLRALQDFMYSHILTDK